MKENARGREIIAQILENMRTQTEELRYSKVVSSSYNVHLHPDDYARLEGLVPTIVQQARRALDEELARLNRGLPLEQRVREWIRQPRVPYERATETWSVSIFPDSNEELAPGDILVDATLVTTDPERFTGSETRRIVTRRRGDDVERRVAVAEPVAETETRSRPEGRVLATLRWRDAQGEHAFPMTVPSIKVGRGGPSYWVDVKLDAPHDVSREHCRIRHDAARGGFFIQDTSAFGTTVDGVALPARATEGEPRAEAPEIPLPARAQIGLAGVITLEFVAEGAA